MRARRRPATSPKPAAATPEATPEGAEEPSIDELLELLRKQKGDEAVDIGPVRGSGNPAPRLRGDDV